MKQLPPIVTRIGYVAFVVFAGYHLLAHRDYAMAASSLGIGLIFDPFGPAAWPERPLWQRAVLLLQVLATFGLFRYSWFIE